MSWSDWLGLGVSGVGSIVGAGLSYAGQKDAIAAQKEIAEQNLAFQREALAQNQANQLTTWNREDTAVQRSAADMQAAGLSKTLAAGNSASSSAPIKVDALHNDYQPISKLDKLGQMVQSMASIGQSIYGLQQAQANLAKTEAETNQVNSQTQATQNVNSIFDPTLEKNLKQGSYDKIQEEINWLKNKPQTIFGRSLWDIENFVNRFGTQSLPTSNTGDMRETYKKLDDVSKKLLEVYKDAGF